MEEMNQTPVNAQASLFAKMARVMKKMERVPKNGENTHFKYKYATESDIADAVRQAMAEENLCLFVEMVNVDQTANRTRAVFEFTFACGDTGATKTCRWEAEASDNQDKGINKVATAALKYFLLKTFIISTGNPEDDADSGKADDTPKGESFQRTNPARQTPPPPPAEVATRRVKALNLGAEVYGDEWPAKQVQLCNAVSRGNVASIDDLTKNELDQLISGMETKLAELKATPPAQPAKQNEAA